MTPVTTSLIDQLVIRQEPRGLLGRYMLSVENELADAGLTVRRDSIKELTCLHDRHAETWNGLAPVLDTKIAPIPEDDAICLMVYDRRGTIVACHACRLVDLGTKSFKAACQDLTFFYGEKDAPALQGQHVCTVTAPGAEKITGRIAYIGALWIEPEWRGSVIARVLPDVVRCYSCTQWPFDYEVTVGGAKWDRPYVQKKYGFFHHEPALSFHIDGEPIMSNGILAYSTLAEGRSRIAQVLAEVAASSAQVDRDQKSLRSA